MNPKEAYRNRFSRSSTRPCHSDCPRRPRRKLGTRTCRYRLIHPLEKIIAHNSNWWEMTGHQNDPSNKSTQNDNKTDKNEDIQLQQHAPKLVPPNAVKEWAADPNTSAPRSAETTACRTLLHVTILCPNCRLPPFGCAQFPNILCRLGLHLRDDGRHIPLQSYPTGCHLIVQGHSLDSFSPPLWQHALHVIYNLSTCSQKLGLLSVFYFIKWVTC